MERRPAAVTRLHTVVEADNHGSLTLLSKLGQMSSDLPNQGVREVTVELPRVNRERTAAETVALMWAQAARKLMNESPLVRWRRSAGLIPTATSCVEFVQRMAEINRELTVKWAEAATSVPFGAVSAKPPANADAVGQIRASRVYGQSLGSHVPVSLPIAPARPVDHVVRVIGEQFDDSDLV